MKAKRKYLYLSGTICACFLLLALFYLCFFGPLVPYCPIKFGFDEIRQDRFTLYYPKGREVFSEHRNIAKLITEAEQFHKLTFKKHLRIVVCASAEQYRRFSMGSGHACTTQTGTVIYIAPSLWETTYPPELVVDGSKLDLLPPVRKGPRPVLEFLKHELSHAILYQNTSLLKAVKINTWLEEGLAVYFGNRSHYYRGKDLRLLAVEQDNFFNIFDDEAMPPHIPKEILHTFRYGIFCAFVDYLITTYTLDAVLHFVHDYIQMPDQEEALFHAHFGTTEEEALGQFQNTVVTGMKESLP